MSHFDITDIQGNRYRVREGWHYPPFLPQTFAGDNVDLQLLLRFDESAIEQIYDRFLRFEQQLPDPSAPRERHRFQGAFQFDPYARAPVFLSEPGKEIYLALAEQRLIIAQERAEAAQHAQMLAGESSVNRALIYTGAFFSGLWDAGVDLAKWAKEVNDVINPTQRLLRSMHASHRALQRSRENGENILAAYADEHLKGEKRELVQALGFDPTAITAEQLEKAMEVADLVWDNAALRADITLFAKDYVKAQHALELTNLSGAAAFEVLFTIILAAVTAGAGLAASAASQARHLAKFRKVGDLLMEFAKQARKARISRNRNTGSGKQAGFDDFKSLGEVEVPKPTGGATANSQKVKAERRRKADISKRKGVPPASLEDAVERLNSMADEIARNGYQPKYTDAELKIMADAGDVSKERYHVRFMESRYMTYNGEPGMLGAPMQGSNGNGAKYWSTTFDQLEDADTDSRLIAEKLGLDYDPDKEYALIVIDTEKAAPLTGVKSVPATFDKVGEFVNRELPDEFPKSFTDTAMTPEFQAEYAKHYQKALDAEFLDSSWSTNTSDFDEYLKTTEISGNEKDLMLQRMNMQYRVGNNQYYEGNGLTRDNIAGSGNEYGAVETLNFEREPVSLQQLEDANAIAYVSKGF